VATLGTVNPVRALYGRFRDLIHETARFSVVGTFSFMVTIASSSVLHVWAGIGPLTSTVVGMVVGTVISYAGNRCWTFRHRQHTAIRREGIRYAALYGVGMAVQSACVAFAAIVLRLHGALSYDVVLVIGTGLGAVVRFWSCRQWVWRQVPAAA